MDMERKEPFLQRTENVEWKTLIERASENINFIKNNNNDLSRQLSSAQMPRTFREKLKDIMAEIKLRTQETFEILKELQKEKYKTNQKVISSCKKIQEALKKENEKFGELAKEISFKKNSIVKSLGSFSDGDSVVVENDEKNKEILVEQFNQVEHDHDLLKERKEDLENIEHFVAEVNGMMQTAAVEVSKQGEVVDLVVQNIGKTQNDVNVAHEEIVVANKEAKKANKKLIWMIVVLVVVVVVVIAIVLAKTLT